MALPLNDIITAITNELKVAEVRADMNRAYWRNIYDDNEFLREFAPSAVKVREVKVSLPLAIAELADESEEVKPKLTTQQLEGVLPEEVSAAEKREIAAKVALYLDEKDRHLLSRTLPDEISKSVQKIAGKALADKLRLSNLDKLRKDYLQQPKTDRQTLFSFSSAELAKIPSEHILRLDFTIEVE